MVLLADGAIDVGGRITANGGNAGYGGSGGSLLLRSLQGVTVRGTFEARGTPSSGASDGFIRIDAYGSAPVVTGTVVPAPVTLQLPETRERSAPRVGTTWTLAAVAVPGDRVHWLVAANGASIPLPPFGILQLDPATLLVLGQGTVPVADVDPQAELAVAVPAAPALAGARLHVQALHVPAGSATPRLTNASVTTIQPVTRARFTQIGLG